MLEKIWRMIILLLFAFSGLLLGDYINPFVAIVVEPRVFELGWISIPFTTTLSFLIGFVTCGIIGYILAPFILHYIYRCSEAFLTILSNLPTNEIVIGASGLIIALILANLLGSAASYIPVIGQYLPLILSVILGIVGVKLALNKKSDIMKLSINVFREKPTKRPVKVNSSNNTCKSKLLDTSVIIDGRILDICKTDFIEGTFIVPGFVLEELQQIADSSDSMKRTRGRRGLDILKEMQDGNYCNIEIVNHDYDDLTEVDAKLIRLGTELDAYVITNDYNLNKVAELQGVKVLNINELANAVKTVVLPGEEMYVNIIKEGKEMSQGVAYLEDGTMIVVEGAKNDVGKMLSVLVTSVLQTAAGRMIFARVK